MYPSPTSRPSKSNLFLFVGFQPTINKCTFLLLLGHLFCVCVYRACVHMDVHARGCPCMWNPEDNIRSCFPGAVDLIFLVRVFAQDPGLS